MKKFNLLLSFTILFLLNPGILSASQNKLVIQGNFPFDTTIAIKRAYTEQFEIEIRRYNLILIYFELAGLQLPHNPYRQGFSHYGIKGQPYSRKDIDGWISSSPTSKSTGTLIQGQQCVGDTNDPDWKACQPSAEINNKGYYYLNGIAKPHDSLCIFVKKIYMNNYVITKMPYPDSIQLQFDYREAVPVYIKPHISQKILHKSQNKLQTDNIYNIFGVKVHPQKAISRVYINSNGRFLRMSDINNDLE